MVLLSVNNCKPVYWCFSTEKVLFLRKGVINQFSLSPILPLSVHV